MPEPTNALLRGYTPASVAALVGGEVVGRGDVELAGLDTLERSGPGFLTFIRSTNYGRDWAGSKAAAALVTRGIEIEGHDPSTKALIVVNDADVALLALLEKLAGPAPTPAPGVHATALIDPSAHIAPTASIGPWCVVGARSSIGEGVTLISGVRVGADCTIGRGTVLHHGVVLYDRTVLGAICTLHAGVVIGADGFGYRPDPKRGVAKIPHLGNVVIGDDVEIGANSCVDRAKFGSTTVGSKTKIDNLVQIGHGCQVGRGCLICGMAAMAGSCNIGDGAILAGQSGVADNIDIGAGAIVGAQAGVTKDIPPGEMWFGYPAGPARVMNRSYIALRGLHEKLREITKSIADLRQDLDAEKAARRERA